MGVQERMEQAAFEATASSLVEERLISGQRSPLRRELIDSSHLKISIYWHFSSCFGNSGESSPDRSNPKWSISGGNNIAQLHSKYNLTFRDKVGTLNKYTARQIRKATKPAPDND